MTHAPLLHTLLAGTLGLALLAGCQPPAAPINTETAATPTPQPATPLGITGKADLNGTAFGGAELKVYRPGQAEPIAVGKTNEDGSFALQVGQIIAAGGGNVIGHDSGSIISTGGGNIISAGGGNIISAGGGNIISAGGGNIIAAGGGNFASAGAPLRVVASKEGQTLASLGTAQIIAAGGGNIIAAGGGNIIAAGGGNIIAAGGGNYTVQQLTRQEVVLTVASTLAVIALGDRLDGAAQASVSRDGRVIEQAVASVLAAFDKLSEAAVATLEASPTKATLQAEVLKALSPEGKGTLPEAVAKQITGTSSAIQAAFREAAGLLSQAIQAGVTAGGETPPQNSTGELTFGDATAPTVVVPTPAPTASSTPAPTPAPTSAPKTSAGSGVDREEVRTNSGSIGIWGNLETPRYGMPIFGDTLSSAWSASVSQGSGGVASGGVYTFEAASGGAYVEFALNDTQTSLEDFGGVHLTARSNVENALFYLSLHDESGQHLGTINLSNIGDSPPTTGWATYEASWWSFDGVNSAMVKRIRIQYAGQTSPVSLFIDELSVREMLLPLL